MSDEQFNGHTLWVEAKGEASRSRDEIKKLETCIGHKMELVDRCQVEIRRLTKEGRDWQNYASGYAHAAEKHEERANKAERELDVARSEIQRLQRSIDNLEPELRLEREGGEEAQAEIERLKEQALRNLEIRDSALGERLEKALAEIERLKGESLISQPAQTCAWTEDADGIWTGACGIYWVLTGDVGPKENEMHFCPRCGKPLVEERYVPEPDEEDEPCGNGGVDLKDTDGTSAVGSAIISSSIAALDVVSEPHSTCDAPIPEPGYRLVVKTPEPLLTDSEGIAEELAEDLPRARILPTYRPIIDEDHIGASIHNAALIDTLIDYAKAHQEHIVKLSQALHDTRLVEELDKIPIDAPTVCTCPRNTGKLWRRHLEGFNLVCNTCGKPMTAPKPFDTSTVREAKP
jgi:uncharacterized protein (DUF983 family)